MRRALRLLLRAVMTLAVLGALVWAVFPIRTHLDQRRATAEAQERLAVLEAETEALEARAEGLDSDDEIERLAREDHGLVMPGEEAYVVLPPPLPEVDLPELWLVGDPDGPPSGP